MLGGELHALLLLSLIAEPHTHHVFLKVELLGNGCNFLAGRTWLHGKICFKGALIWVKMGID